MKKTFTITSALFITIFIFRLSAFAQFSHMGDFVASGLNDGGKLTAAYLKPYTNAVGYGLNAAWFNTAKPHKLLGFNLDFTANVVSVPSSDKTFDINSLGLSSNIQVSGSSIAPTVAGKNSLGPTISYSIGGNKIADYQTPKGLNWGYVPMPIAQLSIGLVKGTEIMGRYIPTTKIGSTGNVGLWGIGVKHSIKQWIPAINKLPLIHLAAMVGYTQLNSTTGVSVTPDMVGATDINGKIDFSNQKLDITIKSFTANGIVSLDLIKLLVVYAGLGVGYTMTDFGLKGNYPIPNPLNYNISANRSEIVGNTNGSKQDIYSNPLNVTIKPGMQPRLNLGVRLKFTVITFNVEYVYSYYSIVTAGLGVNVR